MRTTVYKPGVVRLIEATVEERLQFYSDRTGGPRTCWPWTGKLGPGGYGRASVDGKWRSAHRLAYESAIGPIPSGLEIDHLCRNRACVNPAHLEPVTKTENAHRGAKAQQTHCGRGHELSETNTKIRANGTRRCRVCDALRKRLTRAGVAAVGAVRP